MKLLIVLIFIFSKNILESDGNYAYKYTSYQKSMECFPSNPVVTPKTIEEIQGIITQANLAKTFVKAFGGLHSIVDLICTNGTAINMMNFNSITINPNNTVTAQAGATIYAVSAKLHENNLALIGLPQYGGITIGGATGCGSHGGSLKHPTTISEQVISMKIVDGNGQIIIIEDPVKLQAFRVHLGLLGVVIEVELNTVPQFKVKTEYKIVPLEDDLFNNMLSISKTYDVTEFFWSPNLKFGAVWNGTFIPADSVDASCTDKLTLLPAQFFVSKFLLKKAAEHFQATNDAIAFSSLEAASVSSFVLPIPPLPPPFAQQDGQLLASNPAIGWSHQMLSSYCVIDDISYNISSCAWEGSEYFGIYNLNPSIALPIEKIQEFFMLAKQILKKYPAQFPLGGFSFRFSRKFDSYMGVERNGNVVHIEWQPFRRTNPYNDPIFGLNAFQALVQLMISKLNGRPHWGKNGPIHHNYNNLVTHGVDVTSFINIKNMYDPKHFFDNDFSQRIFTNNSTKVTMDSANKRCALEDNCLCGANTDCAERQICENYKNDDQNARVCSDINILPIPLH